MTLMTPEQFEESLKDRKPRIFMNGKKVENILENKNTRTVVEANKASYAWALDPKSKDIMSCHSPLINDVVNRYTHISGSIEDLVNKAEAGTFTAENLGTCIYRCVGYDAMHSLAATTWEMDRDLGTEYHPRFMEYLKKVQREDLSVAGALTEPRGRRSEKTLDWPDPFLSLKLIDKNEKGIVVRGAKINISGAYASHELIVIPQSSHGQGEEDYAIAFAIPTDTKGLTYVAQYSPYSAEREMSEDIEELGNPLFGQRETSLIIFEDVFVPWERVFHCGETRYSGKLVTRFARTHRMTCGGTCKVGFMNQIIGASKLIQEYKGLEKVSHINEQITEMVVHRETGRACGLAAAHKGSEEPVGSGVFLPDEVMGNVAKLNICNSFWRVMALAGDIGGGMVVTMPSMKELNNPEVKDYINEFFSFGSDEPTENIMKVHKSLQHWTAGMHGVGTWHGAGPVAAQKIMLQRVVDFEHEKDLVRKTLNLTEKEEK
ncbi:MAG: aromatic ring hydroxylase [Deltaproteobacteria bacterium]|nr:aromatic ring hydroxylase [Deltaproteobacteria bacterium]MBT4641158.1 aromatic ring hydroxylase [Deltaproteobacteria bacterium]MBT6502675.1 aromatic ring hydroxylase [Deltaproteobacteria bacterium]MBT7153943.1 aromatic ring hydroxylase [Deltaproteobacteria bacterium]MBT7715789.1 aromatic ring hydroxylase [Deltaproteobacteria bacterium]